MNNIFLFEMGFRTIVCRDTNILLRRNCIYELNGTIRRKKSLETSIGERDWSMARNEMLMVISCYLMVVWATSTQVKREQSLTWMFKYIFIWDISDFRYAIKLITYCLVVLNGFDFDNHLMLFLVSYFGYLPIIVFLHDQNKYHIYLY